MVVSGFLEGLKGGIAEKITPPDDQIANLFPESIEGDMTHRKTGETTISISREELEGVSRKRRGTGLVVYRNYHATTSDSCHER